MFMFPTRRLGRDGPVVSAIGLGCMGMSEFYGRRRTTRSRSASSTARSTRRQFPRHRRHVRRRDERGARRQGDPRPARRGRAGDEVRQRPRRRTASSSASAATREYVRAACDASLKRLGVDVIDLYYQHRVDPEGADRGDGRRDGRAGEGGQGPLPRPVARPRRRRSGARHADAPDRRAPDGVFALEPRRRGGDPADRARARHRLRRLQPARARLPHRPVQDARRPRRRTTSAATTRASRARTFEEPRRWSREIEAMPRRRAARRASSRSPGCWPRARTSCRSPAPSASSISTRTSARSPSELSREELERIDAILPTGAAAGDRDIPSAGCGIEPLGS